MSKSKKNQILIGYMGMAVLFFLISGLSFRNYVKIMFSEDVGYTAFLSGVIFAVFGLLLFSQGIIKRRCRETASTQYAKTRAEAFKGSMDEEGQKRLEQLSDSCIERYFTKTGWTGLVGKVLLYAACSAVCVFGGGAFFVWIVMIAVVFSAISIFIYGKQFHEFLELLTTECRPFAMVNALLKPFGTKQYLHIGRSSYPYHATISLGFYCMGEFETALEHLQMMWGERPGYIKKNMNMFHYHHLMMCCYKELGMLEEAHRQRELLEAYLEQHSNCNKHVYVVNYRRDEKIEKLMKDQCYGEVKPILEELSGPKVPMYQRVEAHSQLWELARLEGDLESASLHSRFVSEYGKDMFYYARINGKL